MSSSLEYVMALVIVLELEESITPRNLRGAALGDEFAIDKIARVEAAIAELRG